MKSSVSTDIEYEAKELVKKAEKTARGNFMSMFTGGVDYDEACTLYTTAANKYKMAKNWPMAADCMLRASYINQKLNDSHREARCLVEAADLMKRYSLEDAVKHYSKAVEIYNVAGKFSQSGKIVKNVADIYDTDSSQELACQYYKRAAELFDMDEYSKSSYTQCILKYAELSAILHSNYEEAVHIFESEGEKALKNNLIQFGAREHFLKAGILLLAAGDITDATIKTSKYEEIDPRFATSREGKLLHDTVEAYGANDVEGFVNAIQEYDSISSLDSWKIHFLYKAKELLSPTGTNALGEVDLT